MVETSLDAECQASGRRRRHLDPEEHRDVDIDIDAFPDSWDSDGHTHRVAEAHAGPNSNGLHRM